MLKIKLENAEEEYAQTTYYDMRLIVEKDGKESEVNGTLSAMHTSNGANTEYDFNIVDSEIDFTKEEEQELEDFAIENCQK